MSGWGANHWCAYSTFPVTDFINRCLFVLNDNQGPVEPVQGLGVVLSEVALLEATTFSTFQFATPQTTEGRHTHTHKHTLAVAVYTQQKESAALLFFYFYAAPRPRPELPQRTGTSAPGRRALRVCQCVLAQRVGGLTKAG